jgi:hypothetical protein
MRGRECNAGHRQGLSALAARVESAARAVSFVLALLQCAVRAGHVFVNAEAPYSEGIVAARIGTIEDIYAAHTCNDTVEVSVGYSFEAATYPVMIPENGGFWDAIMATDTVHARAGLRWSPYLRDYGGPCCYGHGTMGCPDTVWEQATAFPDTLAPLDSIDETGYWRPTSGKWFWVSVSQPWPLPSSSGYTSNWNSVLYIECPGPWYLKLQVAGRSSDTVFVRWAVDSAGNGLFRVSPTPVRETRLPAREALGTSLPLRQYDIRGRVLSSTGTGPSRNSAQRPRALVVAGGRLVWRE